MTAHTFYSRWGVFLLLVSVCSTGWAQDFDSLFQSGDQWQRARQPLKAVAAYEEALRIGDPSDPDYETAMANLGQVYDSLGQYARAERLLKQVVARRKARLPADDDSLGKIIGDLGVCYGSQGKLQESNEYLIRSVAIRRKHHALESFEVLTLLQLIMNHLLQMGKVDESAAFCADLLKQLEENIGPNDSRLRFSLFHLADCMLYQGKYRAADEYIQRGRRLPPESGRVEDSGETEALMLTNLYIVMGRFGEALEQLEKAEKTVALRSQRIPSYRPLLNSLWAAQAEIKLEMGQTQQALQLLLKSLEGVSDLSAPRNGITFNNIGKAYQRLGELDKAEAVFRRVFSTKTYDRENRASAARQLATVWVAQGKTAEVEKLLDQDIKPGSATAQHRLLAMVYLAGGRFADAEKLFRSAIGAIERAEGKRLRDESLCWSGLAQALEAQQKSSEALDATDKSRRLLHQFTVEMLPVFPESEQQAFLAGEEEPAMQKSLALVCKQIDDLRAVELSAAWVLNRKGLAQQALADRMILAREADDPALTALVNDWFSVRHCLAKLTVGEGSDTGSSPAVQKQIEQLTAREQELAQALGRAKVRQATTTAWYTLPQIRQALPPSAIYVDLVRFVPPTGPEQAEYLAWLVPPENKGIVKLVRLGKALEIDEAVAAARRELQKPPEGTTEAEKAAAEKALQRALEGLSERLLKPLWESLAGFEHWVICPDGTPWLVPWSALVLPEKEKGLRPYLVEKYRVSLVISGRDLIEKPSAVSGNKPLMFANPDFDLFRTDLAKSAGTDRVWFNRGAKTRATDIPTNWTRLAGTAQEAQLVAPVLQKYVQHDPQLLLEADATEAAFKTAWRPRILVLSTHGFFLPAPAKASTETVNPLLRCGLVLSGANRPELRLQENHDDGIVTGLEVLSADLRGTELVVLSACETGLGELYAGEGVAGLRQAFQLAGARGVVSTLWQIPDQETAWLMNLFFEKLAGGADKAVALQEAQRTLLQASRKNGEKAAHPYYWAAFTMTGDWRVSEVGPITPRPQRQAPSPQVEVVVEYARVMDGAKVATHVRLGERLVRGEQRGEWIQVFYEPGSKRSGWIQQNEVRAVR